MPFLTSWRLTHRQHFFGPLLESKALVFDIGANHGEYTAAFLSCGAARVVAVEPQPEVAAAIVKAFPSEVRSGAVVVRTKAVGGAPGVAKMYSAPDPGKSMSTLSKLFVDVSEAGGRPWDETAAFEVEVVTLDSLIDEFGAPDYIKIDVEGFDLEVLRGLSYPVSLLSFEFNTNPELLKIAEQCVERVAQLGDYEFNYQAEAHGQTSLQFSAWVPASVMLYALRHDISRSKVFGDIFARRTKSETVVGATSGLPPIHLINLDRSTDRLQRFGEVNRHLHDVTRFAAVDGFELDREALISSGYVADDLSYGTGTIGCALSHVKLWEKAVAEDHAITVFEDDVVASHQFEQQAAALIARLPADWDIIHWGCMLHPLFAWVDLGISRVRLHTYGARRYDDDEGLRQFQEEIVAPGAVKLMHSIGAFGYSISAKGARAAIDSCVPLNDWIVEFPDAGVRTPNEGIDIALCKLYPQVKAFLCVPNLVLPMRGPSDRKATDVAIEPTEV